MAEVLVEFSTPVIARDGTVYAARACGSEMPDGLWQGWIEFIGSLGEVLRSGRETTQPNRADAIYWATGLTPVYLEGALHRAEPAAALDIPDTHIAPLAESGTAAAPVHSVLDPFSVYRKGEAVLRSQLAALSSWHLVNIIRDHELSEQEPEALALMTRAELVELIVAEVRLEVAAARAE